MESVYLNISHMLNRHRDFLLSMYMQYCRWLSSALMGLCLVHYSHAPLALGDN